MSKRKVFFVKNLDQYIENKRDKTSKFIMLIIEKHMEKVYGKDYRKRKEFAEIRNTVFDSINDFYADICLALENHENGESNGR